MLTRGYRLPPRPRLSEAALRAFEHTISQVNRTNQNAAQRCVLALATVCATIMVVTGTGWSTKKFTTSKWRQKIARGVST